MLCLSNFLSTKPGERCAKVVNICKLQSFVEPDCQLQDILLMCTRHTFCHVEFSVMTHTRPKLVLANWTHYAATFAFSMNSLWRRFCYWRSSASIISYARCYSICQINYIDAVSYIGLVVLCIMLMIKKMLLHPRERLWSIVRSTSVCMYVWLCVCVCVSVFAQGYLQNHTHDLCHFLRMLPMAVAQSSSGRVTKSQEEVASFGGFLPHWQRIVQRSIWDPYKNGWTDRNAVWDDDSGGT